MKKKAKIWGCKRCAKTRAVKWYEESDFKKIGYYLCRECKSYERSLQHIEYELNAICKIGLNKTVLKSVNKIRAELAKMM